MSSSSMREQASCTDSPTRDGVGDVGDVLDGLGDRSYYYYYSPRDGEMSLCKEGREGPAGISTGGEGGQARLWAS